MVQERTNSSIEGVTYSLGPVLIVIYVFVFGY